MDNTEIKPSTFMLDEKDASYYRNLFCNNVQGQKNYCVRCKNAINNIYHHIEYLLECDEKRDPNTCTKKETYSSWRNKLEELISEIDNTIDTLTQEFVMLKSKDYEEILEKHAEKIRELESSMNNRELTKYEIKE